MRILSDAWTKLVTIMFGLAACYLIAIVGATILDVVARNTAIHAPIWLVTFIEFGLPISTMFAAPYLVRLRRHVSMELIDAALSTKNRKRIIRLTDITAACVSLLIAYYAALGGSDAFVRGEVIVLAIDVPRWILFAVLVAGFVMCAIEFARHVVISFGDDPQPPLDGSVIP